MKKTLIYVLLLALVGAGVWYFLLRDNDNIFGAEESGFAVRDTASIGKIFIAAIDGQSVTLERSGNGWVVDKDKRVMKAAIDQLLETIRRQEAAYPVSSIMHNKVVESLASDGLKVEIYDRSGRKLRTFFVGNEGPDFDGNYMLMEGAKRPFVVRLAGHMGYLRPRYSIRVSEWRDRHVFEEEPQNIREISVRYEKLPDWSFTMSRQQGKITVNTQGSTPGAAVNEKRAENYLGFFRNVNAESYANGTEKLDSVIAHSDKFCTVDVNTVKGNTRIDVYYMGINERSKSLVIDDDGYTDQKYDKDHFYAVTNGGRDTMVIQMLSFEKIFRNGAEFFEPDLPPAPDNAR